jgi:hypothetical protein
VSELKIKVDDLTKGLEASRARIAELEKKAATPALPAGDVSNDSAELACPPESIRADRVDFVTCRKGVLAAAAGKGQARSRSC